ncbi:hypothetical protein [Gloeobacter violaceus]|uniref:Glr2213 protein n=1 Tax=Gloeobacter violaceus (strain ATCC 29082 / PCC 7421) TaxID=251221 RepID=Q7NIH0_GLOVI|nr:hypothetical protein [Gloeobacter violaceus]BAC90154.1 glr2213 [Gloeobacter violaceus PCC 7421]
MEEEQGFSAFDDSDEEEGTCNELPWALAGAGQGEGLDPYPDWGGLPPGDWGEDGTGTEVPWLPEGEFLGGGTWLPHEPPTDDRADGSFRTCVEPEGFALSEDPTDPGVYDPAGQTNDAGWERAIDQTVEGLSDLAQFSTDLVDGVPVLEQAMDAVAGIVEVQAEFQGGVLKGAGATVEGMIEMISHPLDTAAGLLTMAEHVPGMPVNPLKAMHELYDVAAGTQSLEEAAEDVLNPLESASDDLAFWGDVAGHIVEPYSEAIEEGKYAEAAGRALFDIGGIVLGAGGGAAAEGVAGAGRVAGIATEGAQAARGAALATEGAEAAARAAKAVEAVEDAAKAARTVAGRKTAATAEAAQASKAAEGAGSAGSAPTAASGEAAEDAARASAGGGGSGGKGPGGERPGGPDGGEGFLQNELAQVSGGRAENFKEEHNWNELLIREKIAPGLKDYELQLRGEDAQKDGALWSNIHEKRTEALEKLVPKAKEELQAIDLATEVENRRQALLLDNTDVAGVSQSVQNYGLSIPPQLIEEVKAYNFDSAGIYFAADNYTAWKRLSSDQGTMDDLRYLVHEATEIEELKSLSKEKDFDFMGKDIPAGEEALEWRDNFDKLYETAHSTALNKEYSFLTEQIRRVTGGELDLPPEVIAAVDPTRAEGRSYMQVDGKPLKEHLNFDEFAERGSEPIQLDEKTRDWLWHGADAANDVFPENFTLEDLVKFIKKAPLKDLPPQLKGNS